MEINNEIPKITRPGYQNSTPVTVIFPDHDFVDSTGTHVVQGHYWRRVKATNVPCGNSASVEVSEKTGVSQAILAEVGGALEVAVAPLKSTLSSKVSTTDTFTEERLVSFTMNIGPKECIAITFAEWQRIVRSVLRRQKYFLGFKTRIVERTVDIGTEEFQSDQLEYLDPNCCPAKIEEAVAKGFTDVFSLNFGRISFAVQAKKKNNGKVSLAGIPGEFTPGQVVAIEDVGDYLRSYGYRTETQITLTESLGTVYEFYGWAEKKSRDVRSTSLPWMIVLGTSSLLAYLLGPRSRSQSRTGELKSVEDRESELAAAKSELGAAVERVDSYAGSTETETRTVAEEPKRHLKNYQ
jgi:hypothetical protein